MSKLSGYPSDTSPVDADYVLGDQASGPTTSRFLLSNLTNYFASKIANNANYSNPYKFRVYRTNAYTSANGVLTAMPFDIKQFDTGTNVDVVTNKGRFTAPVAGFYQFNAAISTTTNIMSVLFYKNGSQASGGNSLAGISSSAITTAAADMLQLAANDYVEAYYNINGAVAVSTGSIFTYFSGFLVSQT